MISKLTCHLQFAAMVVTGVLMACCDKQSVNDSKDNFTRPQQDSIVCGYDVAKELAGSDYRTKAKTYVVVFGNDTSRFKCSFMKAKETGVISMDIRFRNDMSYREQLNELKKIVPFAMKDFQVNPDSLTQVFLGRLITTGDPAIEISKEYHGQLGTNKAIDHETLNAFLLRSELVSDWNKLLKPYQITADVVVTEKVFLAENKMISQFSKIESDTAGLPPKILDCMVWIKFKRERVSKI
jgi:hypothetical protein